jgi:F-type H+-transporting ATPase subunit b
LSSSSIRKDLKGLFLGIVPTVFKSTHRSEVKLINLDKTLILQMINFLILLWILNKLIYKPILGVLDRRKNRIRQFERTVQDWETQASQQWDAYQKDLQEARLQANLERERIVGEGKEAQRKLLEEVRDEAMRLGEDTRQRIDDEVAKARDLLKNQAEGIAVEMAEKILGRQL